MQFPVPQFTDVEDKIIGPLTIKQFGILFGAGIFVFLGFSATKSIIVLIFFALIFGLPGLALAFGKLNGRPIYNSMDVYYRFITSQKMLVFHKEASIKAVNLKDAEVASKTETAAPAPEHQDTHANLEKVEELLRRTASDERDIAGKIK